MERNKLPNIEIIIESQFLEDRSLVEEDSFVFSYTVHIKNNSQVTVQLLNRHWFFENARGETYEVEGVGVIGKQPHIAPGEIFSYSSATEINTPDGFMFGSYQMVKNDKTLFNAKIDKCMLNMPRTIH
jgi:ApaG protein